MSDSELEQIMSTGTSRSAYDAAPISDAAYTGPPSSLTPQQQQRFSEWLAKNWKLRACPICEHTSFIPPDRIWRVHWIGSPTIPNVFDDSPIFPCFAVVCATCGYTVWVNATVAGLLP